MSKVNWTKAQREAITARDGSVLVSAAAGSGKTAVLVERIIELITDPVRPVSIDRMLVVTFTRAASTEMRGRIDKALNDLLRVDPYNRVLINQKQLLYNAQISTIDGFCSSFVRRYFYKCGIQNDFRIADEGELKILRSRALDNVIERLYSEENEPFSELVNALCTYRGDDNIRDFILKTYDFLTSIPFMDKRLDRMSELYDSEKPFVCSPYAKYIFSYADDCCDYCLGLIRNLIGILEDDEFLTDAQKLKLRDMLLEDNSLFDSIKADSKSLKWDDIKATVDTAIFSRFPTIKGAPEGSAKDIIKLTRDNYRDELKKLSELFFTDLCSIQKSTEKLSPLIDTFISCVRLFRDEFRALKNEKNILDFADIELMTIDLLCELKNGEIVFTDISGEISECFDCVMVDEFQDINEVQDLIFRAVCRERNNLFVVGDVKQSIYGFRQAKPDIFIGYKDKYTLYNPELNEYPAKIILDKNFRSRKGVTQACNFVFSTLMSRAVGGVEYNDEERLVCSAEFPEPERPAMELMLVDSSDLNAEENETELVLEARAVAEKIHRLVRVDKVMINDKNGERPLSYGDIAILLRSPKGDTRRAVTFVNVLNEMLIPTASQEKNSFFDISEIKILLNLLRVIDNPVQDIPVLSVLMSPIFGFTADDMAEIRQRYRKIPIYNAVKNCAADNRKCQGFIDCIDNLRALSVTVSVDKLIEYIMRTTGYDAVIMAKKNTQPKNIYLLREYARAFAKNGYTTLGSFISYIDRLRKRGGDLDSCDENSDDNLNAVCVMSIHSSKGLEFPVCFICCTSVKFNTKDTGEDLVLDAENGIGFRIREDILKFDTIQRRALALMKRDELYSEEMRILYVAMTRAKERLIVTASSKDIDSMLLSVETKMSGYPLSPFVVKRFSSFAEWIICSALAHPSCVELRTNIKPVSVDASLIPWSIERIEKKDLSLYCDDETPETEPEEIEEYVVDDEFRTTFERRMSFSYKNKALCAMPQKVSASELSHKDSGVFERILRKPSFMSGEKPEGVEKGTAFHTFMQYCDLESAVKNSRLEAEALVDKGFLSERQREIIDYDKLDEFLGGELIRRVLDSDEFYREYRFTIKINASDYDPYISPEFSEQKIVMQGAVDLFFVKNGEAVIVDYKTDRVKDVNALSKMYSKQLQLYKRAVEECTDYSVKELLIYSVYNNRIVTV